MNKRLYMASNMGEKLFCFYPQIFSLIGSDDIIGVQCGATDYNNSYGSLRNRKKTK